MKTIAITRYLGRTNFDSIEEHFVEIYAFVFIVKYIQRSLTINCSSLSFSPFVSSRLERRCLTSWPLIAGTVKIARADEGRIVEDGCGAECKAARSCGGGSWFALSGEPTSREIDSSILCAVARDLVPTSKIRLTSFCVC